MSNPYSSLEARAFWSPAVGKRSLFDISDLWKAPFAIDRRSRIATFGSCFAQHFSRALVARGFTWLDAEPAPEGLSAEHAKAYNYGVFTARTANIYTTSLLRQWTEWALGHAEDPKIFWEDEAGRIYDPFRPVIEPGGFASPEEMFAARARCIEAFRTAIMESDIFVFTLGLTESWFDAEGGWEYPMCPGTAAGSFDAEKHVFRNQDYEFVRKNLMQAIRMMRAARKGGPRFLLTVSPVPLTATNSGNHVLVATMESKSILRAVAGNVAGALTNVSYFPSYEIINSPAYRGSFFEPNMRSVNPHGVDHVMKTFFAGLPEAVRKAAAAPAAQPGPRKGAKGGKGRAGAATSADDTVCEEELLAAFGSGD
ncbi:GSCFA domain-containing protein [Salipiger sp.]|uniref:GSCFA domain-containing protein n=1 Tax=Salipiger sp. TaxID=2078585 RepID=UPI003A98691C